MASTLAIPGLIEDELTVAMDENDICLQGIPIQIDEENEKKFLKEDSSDLFPVKTSVSNEKEVKFSLRDLGKSFCKILRHRGPDANGIWIDVG